MKTNNEILTDVIQVIKTTPIADLNGDIYKRIRPTNSKLEDVVVNIISGNSTKFLQDGALYVKIYYQDIESNSTYYENTSRAEVIQNLLFNLSTELLNTNGYSYDVQSRQLSTQPVQQKDLHEHFALLIINFQLTI